MAKRVRDSAKEYAARKEYQAAYRAANKERRAAVCHEYYVENAEAKKEYARAYLAENYQKIMARRRASDNYRKAATARAVAWQKENAERVNANHRARGKANPHIGRAKTANRNAAMRKRMPPWFGELDALVILEASELAGARTKLTGVAWDVDHVLPIRGKVVSGLHVWNNIQVIPAKVNRSKGNTVVPEMLS